MEMENGKWEGVGRKGVGRDKEFQKGSTVHIEQLAKAVGFFFIFVCSSFLSMSSSIV